MPRMDSPLLNRPLSCGPRLRTSHQGGKRWPFRKPQSQKQRRQEE